MALYAVLKKKCAILKHVSDWHCANFYCAVSNYGFPVVWFGLVWLSKMFERISFVVFFSYQKIDMYREDDLGFYQTENQRFLRLDLFMPSLSLKNNDRKAL